MNKDKYRAAIALAGGAAWATVGIPNKEEDGMERGSNGPGGCGRAQVVGVRVRHVLSDGRELDSIEGLVIPPTGRTEAVYRLVAGLIMDRAAGRHGQAAG